MSGSGPARVLRPPNLPKFTRAQAGRICTIAEAVGAVDVVAGQDRLGVTITKHEKSGAPCLNAHFQTGAGPLTLVLPYALLSALLLGQEPSLVLEPPPSSGVLGLLVDVLLTPVMSAWPLWPPGGLRFTDLAEAASTPGNSLALRFANQNTSWHVLASGEAAIDQMLDQWPSGSHALSQLPVSCRFWVGMTELPMNVVASLERGDAIVIQHRPDADLSFRVAEILASSVRQAGDRVALLGGLRPVERGSGETMTGPNSTNHGAADLEHLDQMPVRLSFDLSQMDLPLADVRRLQPGSILPLNKAFAELVSITANGRRIGTGELVDVEGTAAVRIVRLFGVD